MKKLYSWLFIAYCLLLTANCFSQPDTNLYQTSTSANVAAWLKNLSLTTGSGHISILDPQLGGMLVSGGGRTYVDNNSVSAYYANTTMFNTDLTLAGQDLRRKFRKMQQAGAFMARSPALMPWGVIEPVQGTLHYEFIDSTVKVAGLYGVKLLGTVIPLADWSQTCNAANSLCNNLYTGGGDYFFLNNGKAGAICDADTSYFYTFAQNLVERYDGDGVNDMPGLKQPITVWEFHNEPDACVNYSSAKYVRDQDIFYRAMKAACSSCTLINGGWGGLLSDSTFWQAVIPGCYKELDEGNIHCNDGRMFSPFSFKKMFYLDAEVFQEQIKSLALNWNIWVTEWGIYSGSPNSLPNRTEEEQASMYTKIHCWSLANNITNFFYDLKGSSSLNIGSAALLQENIGPKDSLSARLFYYTQKLLEYKFRTFDSVKVFQMDTSVNLPKGDIRFYKSGSTHYVLWGLSALPSGLSGVKNVTDIYGNITTQNVSSLSIPLGSKPIIVEDTSSATAMNEIDFSSQINIYPNPTSGAFELRIANCQNCGLKIYNTLGQIVYQSEIHNPKSEIDLSEAPAGIYFLKLGTEQGTVNKKIIINK
ncbi:MAG: T9SS type A sorting domain-containing protein [Bacteroidetes bacterium]|nr:T9SS type A sorting domain-containing protein [Bacteroidota bacterium]